MSARIGTVSRILPVGQVKLFYDRFGRLQEGQVFYEGWALEDLEQHGRFDGTPGIKAEFAQILKDFWPDDSNLDGDSALELENQLVERLMLL